MLERIKNVFYNIMYWLEPFFWLVLAMIGVTMLWVNK